MATSGRLQEIGIEVGAGTMLEEIGLFSGDLHGTLPERLRTPFGFLRPT
ncbi:hypothetical protein VSR69_09985 [Paraburkholderia phytofirmans]|jgi:hypothetical protein|nr:hypothetical protein [Paraburkholderia sp. BL9I2N2]TCK88327.1 hypothetical protein B0G74_6517 [Paraburkholderia sp. BL9I2N2]